MNPELELTLDDAVEEVLGMLTGLDLAYSPEFDRYRAITRQLNRAMRAVALEREWSYYASQRSLGPAVEGVSEVTLPSTLRPRIINDDAVRLVDADGNIRMWAYFLPRDAIYKQPARSGLWASVVRNTLIFSRPFRAVEDGMDIMLPVMREPEMFRLPAVPEDPEEPLEEVSEDVRLQLIDFAYPDLVILRAAYYYAQSDPVMQPRVPTIEAQMKDLMYQIIEREDRNTDSPQLNGFFVPIQGSLDGYGSEGHAHPHADERRW